MLNFKKLELTLKDRMKQKNKKSREELSDEDDSDIEEEETDEESGEMGVYASSQGMFGSNDNVIRVVR